jgi:RNA polymerase sigma factor (sigma-70 family)
MLVGAALAVLACAMTGELRMMRRPPFPDDLPELESAPVPTAGVWASDLPEADLAVPREEPDLTLIAYYFRDVRRYPLLSHAGEMALARQIHDGGRQWREELVRGLVHVPLLLAWRARLRRGLLPVAAVCDLDDLRPLPDVLSTLDQLHRLRCQMRRLVQGRGGRRGQAASAEPVAALRAEMQALLASWSWQPAFLSQAWTRFDTAMAAAPARQHRQAGRYRSTLGYSLSALRAVWQALHHLDTGVERAKHEMMTGNLRLVISVARAFSHTSVPLTDLIQEGNIGLMRAVDKFDYRRNLRFSTYAVWWIKQAMRRAVCAQSALIHIPEYLRDCVRRVHQSRPGLASALGRAPTAQDLAQHLDLPVERVERSLALVREPISLDRPRRGEETSPLRDVLADVQANPSQEVQDVLVQQALSEHIQRALDSLTPREAEVMRRRFGLHGKPEEHLRQVGEALHLSHERVRQIEAAALAQLRQHSAPLHVFLEP